MPRSKAPPAPKPRARDHAREAAGRATSKQLGLALTPDERAEIEALAADLGAPMKQTILASVRAARALFDGQGAAVGRRLLRADLEPLKPGPKTDEDEVSEH